MSVPLEEMIRKLPPEYQQEVEDFVEFKNNLYVTFNMDFKRPLFSNSWMVRTDGLE